MTFNIELVACPNCTKFETELPRLHRKTPAKFEVDQMIGSRETPKDIHSHRWRLLPLYLVFNAYTLVHQAKEGSLLLTQYSYTDTILLD